MDSSGLPPLVRRVLAARGLTDPDAIQAFCDPRLNDLHPPESLPGADAAAARLVSALRNDETIALYGDYDLGGITATAILVPGVPGVPGSLWVIVLLRTSAHPGVRVGRSFR